MISPARSELAAGIAWLVHWLRARRDLAACPVETCREICLVCGHVEDHRDAGVAASWMSVHRAANHPSLIGEIC